MDAARQQAQHRDLAVVVAQQVLSSVLRSARIALAGVVDQFHRRRLAFAPVDSEIAADAQHHVLLLCLDRRFRISRRRLDLDRVLAQELDQVRRVLHARHRQLQRLFGPVHLAIQHHAEHAHDQHRPDQRPHQQRIDHGAPIAHVLAHFLDEYHRHRAHAASPSSLPITFTNASSRFDSPVLARNSSGEPCATT